MTLIWFVLIQPFSFKLLQSSGQPHFCIVKTHYIITLHSLYVGTFVGPIFIKPNSPIQIALKETLKVCSTII